MKLLRIVDHTRLLLFLLMLGAVQAHAQDMVPLEFGSRATCATAAINNPAVIREAWENTLARSPGIVEAVRQFSLQKGNADLRVGDRNVFWVYNLQKKSFDTVRAELKMSGALSYVWVALGEWDNGHVTGAEVDAIHRALESATSQSSLDSTKGILQIARQAYGNPPNVGPTFEKGKGDGKTHFLMCDILEGWSGTGSYVAGFFYSVDVDPFTGAVNTSNRRDMLYIDSYPGIFYSGRRRTSTALATLAHEFQHLVHWNYDPHEVTFFNEGCSEYAEFLCGFGLRSPLGYFGNTNLSLTGWNGTVEDYSRAALWTRFVGEQYGLPFVRNFVQNSNTGITAFEQALVQSGYSKTFAASLANFYLANWMGERGLDPATRYSAPLAGRPILRGDYIDPNIQRTDTVLQQGVHYISFASARSFRATLTFPATLSVRAIESGLSSVRIRDVASGVEFTSPDLGTQFSSLVFVVMNTQPVFPVTYSIAASGELLRFVVEELHDSGTPHPHSAGFAPYLGFGNNGHSRGMAVRFQPVVKGNVLRKARLLVAFNQEFSNGTALPTDDKDFIFHVWKDQNGRPGTDLIPPFLVSVNRITYPAESFVDVDLTPYESKLTNVTGPVYVGLMEDADDSVGTYVGVDNFTTEDFSYVYRGPNHPSAPNSWQTMREVSALNNNSLDGFNLMMRAVFEYSDSSSAPLMVLGYLQNPLLSEYIDVIATSADEIRATSLTGTMTQATGSAALRFVAIPNSKRAFMDSTQRLAGTGAVSLKVRAAKKYGIFYADTTVSLNARLLRGDQSVTLSTPGGEMSLRFGEGAVAASLIVTASDGLSDPAMALPPGREGEKVFSVGPAGTRLGRPARISIAAQGDVHSKTIAHFRDGKWRAIPTEVDRLKGEVTASVSQLGTFGLVDRDAATGTSPEIPREYALFQNYPNPFNPNTAISYQLSEAGRTHLRVFDVLGREVASLVNEEQIAGWYIANWNGLDNLGRPVSSGVYFYRLESGGQSMARRMVLMK